MKVGDKVKIKKSDDYFKEKTGQSILNKTGKIIVIDNDDTVLIELDCKIDTFGGYETKSSDLWWVHKRDFNLIENE